MDKELEIELLHRELHGLDCELKVARTAHIQDTQTIVCLERERSDLVSEIDRLSPYE